MKYDKIIFVCTRNTFLSPLAEAIFRAKAPDWIPALYSRGLVVLFEEPINPKVNLLLSKYNIQISNHEQSRQMEQSDITEDSLILTMTLSEKVQFLENFGDTGYIYTLGEYTGEETDVLDPYGEGEEKYVQCCEELLQRIDLMIECLRRDYQAET